MASVLLLVFNIFILNCVALQSPTITYITHDQIKDIGATVKLECSVKNAENHTVIWKKLNPKINGNHLTLSRGKSKIHSDDRFSIHHNESTSTFILKIQNLEESDAGIYCCGLIPGFPQVSASVKLQVRRRPVFLNNSTRTLVTTEGKDVQLECFADGYPTPTITWRRKFNKSFQTGDSIYQGNVLSIASIKRQDRGTYYCVASNKVGRRVRRSVKVVVEFAPVVTVTEGLTCRVEAYPPPVITWLKNDIPLSFNSQHHSIWHFSAVDDVTDAVLRINFREREEYGKYVCQATNRLGVAEGEIDLLRTQVPDASGDSS